MRGIDLAFSKKLADKRRNGLQRINTNCMLTFTVTSEIQRFCQQKNLFCSLWLIVKDPYHHYVMD